MPIRFHLDEHIPSSVADGLRRRGIDVSTAADVNLVGATDKEQLEFAASEGRVMVTHDADFLRLHTEGIPNAGVAYCHQLSISVGEMLRRLVLIHDLLSPEEMLNHVEFL